MACTIGAGLCAPAAAADTFIDRFAPAVLSPLIDLSAPAGAAPELALAAALPDAPTAAAVDVPMPRIALRRTIAGEQAPVAPRARGEELVSAYAPAGNSFASWLPRLLPSGIEPSAMPPAQEQASVDPLPRTTHRFGRRGRPIPPDLAALIAAKAHKHGVPVALAHAVVTVESNYNPKATGRGATLGLMQIKHPTARSLGFTGTVQELYDPATNLEYGMRYLAQARRMAKGDICGTVMRYQGGLRATQMSAAAIPYCAKVKALLNRPSQNQQVAAAPLQLR